MGLFVLTAINSIFRYFQKRDLKKQLSSIGKLFFYRDIHLFFFPKQEYEGLFFANTFAQNLLRFSYAIVSLLILINTDLITQQTQTQALPLIIFKPISFFYLAGFFVLFFLVGDYLPRIISHRYPELTLSICAIPASFFMLAVFPFTFLLLKLSQIFSHTLYLSHLRESQEEAQQEIIDMIQDANVGNHLDLHDKKLLESVMDFKDRIAREVMVPRVDMFSLADDTPIKEAAKLLLSEGYSRTPVYKDSLDNIVGVLMYKDILAKYMEATTEDKDLILNAPISTLVKNVIYTPETKKISQLLQEFRKKQVHLAIIVDEYGGTEGIVTIEDILEEIVGDISDEYDQEEEVLFQSLPNGGWTIDGRMGILDIEAQLGIEIPQEGDYDTIGGYIFHEAGMIPPKGFIIYQPHFELEILRSNDRRVEKVHIRPLNSNDSDVNSVYSREDA